MPSLAPAAPVLSPALKSAAAIQEERQVILHCYHPANAFGYSLRIWPTAILRDPLSGTDAGLIHIEGISLAPQWTEIMPGREAAFTLIFEGLPDGCVLFDFLENIPEPGGFECLSILRNKTDVYRINLEGCV